MRGVIAEVGTTDEKNAATVTMVSENAEPPPTSISGTGAGALTREKYRQRFRQVTPMQRQITRMIPA